MDNDTMKLNSNKDTKRGGTRPGSGRPKGSMDEDTKFRRNAERKYKESVEIGRAHV